MGIFFFVFRADGAAEVLRGSRWGGESEVFGGREDPLWWCIFGSDGKVANN